MGSVFDVGRGNTRSVARPRSEWRELHDASVSSQQCVQ